MAVSYRVYQHSAGKLWGIAETDFHQVSTRWGPEHPAYRMPFEKTRSSNAASLEDQKRRKGYRFLGTYEYDESGNRVDSQAVNPTKGALDGVSLELITPWELDGDTVGQIHVALREWLHGLCERTTMILPTEDGIDIGGWTFEIGADLDLGRRTTTLQIPVSEPLPVLVMAALREQLPERFRAGFTMAFSTGEQVPTTGAGLRDSAPLGKLLDLDRWSMEELLIVVGLLAAKPDWSQATASGSDWF